MTNQRWEYKCFQYKSPHDENILMSPSGDEIAAWLNGLAADGWELVAAANGTTYKYWVFRRTA